MDLLLDLIRKQQIDIKDIPIATITSQYLEYMEKAREMDIDLGAEFVYMAATLIHIKSKMLLPRDPALEADGETPEDPRQELVDRLLEHERFKNAAEMLQQKRMIEENVWSNPQIKPFVSEDDDPGPGHHPFRPRQSLRRDAGARQEPPGLRSGIRRRDGGGHDALPAGISSCRRAKASRSSSCASSSGSAPAAP